MSPLTQMSPMAVKDETAGKTIGKTLHGKVATAHLVDACMRLKIPYRLAPAGIKPVTLPDTLIYGPAIPVRHYGSVDIFLEVLETTQTQHGILVIDNGGRQDEACIGDLIVLEAQQAGMQAMVVWGLHRDNRELTQIRLPVFSYGAYPSGPARLDAREAEALDSARFGNFLVTPADTVFLDQDGVLFLETDSVDEVIRVATTIQETEMHQAKLAKTGCSLREQFQFEAFLQHREQDATYTFRKHLTALSKSIEE